MFMGVCDGARWQAAAVMGRERFAGADAAEMLIYVSPQIVRKKSAKHRPRPATTSGYINDVFMQFRRQICPLSWDNTNHRFLPDTEEVTGSIPVASTII